MAVSTDPLEDFSFVVNWGGARTGMMRVSTFEVEHQRGEPSRWFEPCEFAAEGAGAYGL